MLFSTCFSLSKYSGPQLACKPIFEYPSYITVFLWALWYFCSLLSVYTSQNEFCFRENKIINFNQHPQMFSDCQASCITVRNYRWKVLRQQLVGSPGLLSLPDKGVDDLRSPACPERSLISNSRWKASADVIYRRRFLLKNNCGDLAGSIIWIFVVRSCSVHHNER